MDNVIWKKSDDSFVLKRKLDNPDCGVITVKVGPLTLQVHLNPEEMRSLLRECGAEYDSYIPEYMLVGKDEL